MYIQYLPLNKYVYSSDFGDCLMASSISEYILSFFSFSCSLKNLPVPKIDESIDAVSIKPAELNSSIVGRSDNFCILK